MRLDESSPIPLYYQLENIIRRRIEIGEYKPGERIPSLNQLNEEFNLSKVTISKAVANLIEEGILYRERGQGTFVSEEKVKDFSETTGFTETMIEEGRKPSTKVISQDLVSPSELICDKLMINDKQKVILTVRIRIADEIPVAFEKSYIPYAVAPKLLELDLSKDSIYQHLREEGYSLNKTIQEIEAIEADKELSDLLEVKRGKAILKRKRLTFSNGNPVEFSFSFYPGDRYVITTESISTT
ncbi:GntR family transcriptional regulator [Orenia metallireducens]|uniref:GntR family transcriptional regulator n=1 Tax=Orenia metallireducens TaxID=1413210 RepID=A0A285GCE6_9FIRM|nr:GntR family transcriptional regulator [Orenia metallireducens]PRX32478.1 GntR family transcriptional regulator [Orenia metallireducens]SNY21135.1 GntR family transcriptional regulator [Orenia metallireducens]